MDSYETETGSRFEVAEVAEEFDSHTGVSEPLVTEVDTSSLLPEASKVTTCEPTEAPQEGDHSDQHSNMDEYCAVEDEMQSDVAATAAQAHGSDDPHKAVDVNEEEEEEEAELLVAEEKHNDDAIEVDEVSEPAEDLEMVDDPVVEEELVGAVHHEEIEAVRSAKPFSLVKESEPIPAAAADEELVLVDIPAPPTSQVIVQDVVPNVVQEDAPKPELVFSEPVTCPDTSVKTCPAKSRPTDGCCVNELIYWRDPRKTGVVFGSILAILISLTKVSFISVFSYASLAVLLITISFRLYKSVLQAVQKTQDGHPFKELFEADVALPAEKVHEVADAVAARLNGAVVELRRLFLVEDIVDSIKFGIILWVFTYIGAMFNGITLIILGVVGLFTLPKVYETHQDKIDQNVDLVRGKINEVVEKIQAVVPIGKKPKSQ